MEYGIENIDRIKIGDVLILDIDDQSGKFPDSYSEQIRLKNEQLQAEMAAYVFLKDLKIRILFKDQTFKKIGIVVDNYKLEKVKAELAKKDYLLLDIYPFNASTTSITFPVSPEHYEKTKLEIFAIISSIEAHFKRRN